MGTDAQTQKIHLRTIESVKSASMEEDAKDHDSRITFTAPVTKVHDVDLLDQILSKDSQNKRLPNIDQDLPSNIDERESIVLAKKENAAELLLTKRESDNDTKLSETNVEVSAFKKYPFVEHDDKKSFECANSKKVTAKRRVFNEMPRKYVYIGAFTVGISVLYYWSHIC